MIAPVIRDWIRNRLASMVRLTTIRGRDSKGIYPTEQVRKMGELGFLGMMVSPEYGGGAAACPDAAVAKHRLHDVFKGEVLGHGVALKPRGRCASGPAGGRAAEVRR